MSIKEKIINNRLLKFVHNNPTKCICFIETAIFMICLIPLFVIAHYNYPAVDDFSFANDVKQVLLKGGSFWEIIKEAFFTAGRVYKSWQGTYAATFFASLSIGTLQEELYFVGTYFILGTFLASELLFMKTVLRDVLKTDKYTANIVSLPVIMMQIWLVPFPAEAFYWYDGAVAYTLFYSISLCLFSVLLKLYAKDIMGKKRNVYIITAMLLAFLVGGGNFATGLVTAIVCTVAVCFFVLIGKRKRSGMFVIWFTYIMSFAINIAAPGNQMRQTNFEKTSAVMSILKSLAETYRYISVWTSLPVILVIVFLIPFIWKMVSNSGCRFRYPLFFSAITFGIFAANLTPVIYALNNGFPGRLINLMYFCYYFFLVGNLIYFMGWFHRVLENVCEEKGIVISDLTVALKDKCRVYFMILIIIEFAVFGTVLYIYGLENLSSFSAFYSLKSREASVYKEEWEDRLKLLYDESVKNVELLQLSVKPRLLFFDDITEDSADWKNQAMALYYGKESVVLKAK